MTQTRTIADLDSLVQQVRGDLADAPDGDTISRLQEFASWAHDHRRHVRKVRWVAYLGALGWVLGFGVAMWMLGLHRSVAGWAGLVLPMAALLGASRAAERSRYRAQVLARVLLLSVCMVGASVSMFQNLTFDSQLATGLGWNAIRILVPSAVLMSWLLGSHGLRTPRRPFARTGFESVLSLSLVMGLADATFLVLVGIVTRNTVAVGPWPFVLPVVLGLAAYGLMRGKTWGLLVMALTNLAEVALIVSGQLLSAGLLHSGATLVLLVTATVQVLLPIPVYAAILTPKGRWTDRLQRIEGSVARVLGATVVLLLMLSAVAESSLSRAFLALSQ